MKTAELKVIRAYKLQDYTIGKLYLNGKYFCDTLEDKDRGLTQKMKPADIVEIKVHGKTAIPTGRYQFKMTWSSKFKRQLPELIDVPGFKYIRIHAGNTQGDTEGCILVGENKKKGMVLNSRVTLNSLLSQLSNYDSYYITIV